MTKHLLFGLALLLALYSCGNDQHWNTETNICGQEPCYEGPFEAPWIEGHGLGLEFIDENGVSLSYDNRVLETENVLTFSDASEDWAKEDMARMTEDSFREIKQLFYIGTSAELGILDLYTKLRIYSKRNGSHDQCANPNGFILYGLDNPNWEDWWTGDEEDFIPWYRRQVKHELTHVVQYKLGGDYHRIWIWFNEGIAETVSGGVFTPIRSWQEVEAWRQDPDHINPISIGTGDDFPASLQNIGEYYPLFGLAVRYLLDPAGRGRTITDLKALFIDMGGGMSCAEAFEIHMGLSLEEYQANFWEWMEAYLRGI